MFGTRIQAGRCLPAVVKIVDGGEVGHTVQIVFELNRVALELLAVWLVDVDFFLCDLDVLAIVMMSTDEIQRTRLIAVVMIRLSHEMVVVSQFAFNGVRVVDQQRMMTGTGLIGVVIWQRRWRWNMAGVIRMTESIFVQTVIVVCATLLSVHGEVRMRWQRGRATIQMLVGPMKCHITIGELGEIAAEQLFGVDWLSLAR